MTFRLTKVLLSLNTCLVLSVQKVLSGSGRPTRLRLRGKYIGHRLVARPEPDNTFCTDSTLLPLA